MVVYWARDNYQLSYAIGTTDLTAWDNAQAALVVGELNAIDWFIMAEVQHTKPKTININPAPATHYPKRISAGRQLGSLSTTHYLQTGILTYATLQACATVGAGAPYTHTITKVTTETPIRLAFHVEKEGATSQRRKDMMGFLPRSLDIYVSETQTVAIQTFTGDFAFTGAGADLAQPNAFVQATHIPYTWFHYKSTSSASAFTYNSGDINADIIDLHMHIGWSDVNFSVYDGNGYPTNGTIIPPADSYVEMEVRMTDGAGTGIDTIADTVHTSYAGNIDLIVDFYESANRYLKYTWTDMYIDPTSYRESFQREGDWIGKSRFKLLFRDETSSVATEEKNALAKTYYEND